MYPVSGAVAPSGSSDSRDDGGNGEGGAAQSCASVGDLQQFEAPPATDSAIHTSAIAAVGEEVSARGKGKAPAKKPAAVSSSATATLTTAKEGGDAEKTGGRTSAREIASFNIDPVVLDSLGVKLHPDNVGAINVLFYDASVLAARVYESLISKQLPPEVRDKLSATGRTIWCRTYRVLCEVGFSYKCFREYHAKHRPGFIRSLPTIKVLSNSSGSDAEILAGDELLNFLSKLDSAIFGMMVSFFNSRWNEATGKILSPLEGKSLSDISCVDFTNVLDIASVPSIVTFLVPYLRIHASTKRYKKYNKVFSGGVDVIDLTHSSPPSPQSLLSQSESRLGSSLPSEDVSGAPSEPTHSEAGVIHGNVGVVQSIKCVDLLGVKLHPASAKLVYKLFSNLREAARASYSKSILNYLLEAVGNSELSAVGRAIWCKMYRELHLYNFVSRCLSVYHCKYRPDFVRALSSIRVLSNSSDKLVQLSGAGLLDFLSKLDCAIREAVESIFNTEWDGVANRVFAELEDESLDDICCEDVINVLNVTGIPAAAFSAFQRRTLDQRNALESSSRVTNEDAASGSGGAVFVHSSSSLQPQPESELPPQPEPELPPQPEPVLLFQLDPELLSGAVGTYLFLVIEPTVPSESSLTIGDVVLVSTAEGVAPGLGVLGSELSVSSHVQLDPGLLPQPEPELLPQPEPELSSEPELLSEAVGSYFSPIESIAASVVPNESSSNIGDVVLVSTAEAIVPDLVVLGSELSVPSPIQLEPGLSPQPEPESLYGAIGSPLSVSSPVSLSEPAPLFLPSSESRSVSDISSASLSTEEVGFRSTTIVAPPAFWGLEGESLSPPSSLSILPASSSSPSLFSSTSESGCDADVSSYSPESPELTREVAGPATESAVSALGVSLGESHSVTSCEQPMVASTTASSSVSASATGGESGRSIRGGSRGRPSSSHRGSTQRGRGRKRRRE